MKALVLFSGGLDSTVLATQLKAEGAETRLLSIDYGQRHARELKRAELANDDECEQVNVIDWGE